MCIVTAREDEVYEPSRVKYSRRSYREYSPSPPRSVRSHKHRHHGHRESTTSHRSRRTSYVEEAALERAKSVKSDIRSSRSGPRSVATWMPPAPPSAPGPPPAPHGHENGSVIVRETSNRTRAPSVRSSKPPPARDQSPERKTVYESSRSYAVEVERDPPTPPPEPIPEPSITSSSSSSTEITRATSHHSKPKTRSYAGTEYSVHELEYERRRGHRAPRDEYATYQYVDAPNYRRPPREPPRQRPQSNRGDWEETDVRVRRRRD